jgi:signal transduction histidine kinase
VPVPAVLRPLTSVSTFRRWVFFILGAALSTPFLLAAMVMSSLVSGMSSDGLWLLVHGAILVALLFGPMVVTGLFPPVRLREGPAARELLGAPETIGEGRTWSARVRTCGWFVVWVTVGAFVGILSIGLPVWISTLTVAQARGGLHGPFWRWLNGWHEWVLLGGSVVALVALVYGVALAGALATRLAPVILGPSPAERVAEVQRRADMLAERNRLARELHDSVGHALSIVTVQAGAAGRVLESDPAFVRTALEAIEESARGALEDLDHVLGLLREETTQAKAPQRTLKDLDDLLRKTGMKVDSRLDGDLGKVPPAVSREAYRIVQEGLTNALKHAGEVPVTLRIAVGREELELEMINPMGGVPRVNGHSGGRGLPGIRERVGVLRGELSAGPHEGDWRVAVSIPFNRSMHA